MKSTGRWQTEPGLVTLGAIQMTGARVVSFPEGEFSPVMFFAKVPAVVAPEEDEGVVAVGRLLGRVEEPAEVHVGVGDGSEVGLEGFLPTAGFQQWLVVGVGVGHFDSGGRNVIEVVFELRWEHELDGGKQVVVFLRDGPRPVRRVETDGEDEGFVVFAAELGDAVVGDPVIGQGGVVVFEGLKFDAADAVVFDVG